MGRYCYQKHHKVLMWFHSGLYKYNEDAWAMEMEAEEKMCDTVTDIFITSGESVYHIDRAALVRAVEDIDDTPQYVAKASDSFVSEVGRASDLPPQLAPNGRTYENYHQNANH
jgi:hypothetical protein